MTLRARIGATLSMLLFVAGACEKVDTGVDPIDETANFSRFVAMGTSVTMGFASDGVVSASQQSSWAKLLANDVGVTFDLPLIDAPGCPPPIVAPLSNFRRADNSTALTSSTVCSANSTGVVLPEQNVAVSGQTAGDALTVTSATAATLTARVLGINRTQVAAMRAQNPTFVAVEFGGNELLPALSGVVGAGTVVPLATFTANYQTIIDNVKQTGAKALLALVPTDFTKFPSLRTAAEIAAQRNAFVARNVTVNTNCNNSLNYVTVQKALVAVATGAVRAATGLGPVDLSCADVVATADGILTPGEIGILNSQATQMNAFITAKAAENNYATFSLGTLYDTSKDGVAFDLNTILTSNTPFGPRISLDAVHPSAAGQAILAAAAKAAIIAKYGSISK